MAAEAFVFEVSGSGWFWEVRDGGEVLYRSSTGSKDAAAAAAAGEAILGDEWPGSEIDATWHYVGDTDAPAFLNGWSNDDPDFLPLAFRIHEDGEVDLQGNISGGSSGVIFTLPAGYRPSATAAMVAFTSAGGACVIAIGTDGTVLATPAPSALLMAGQFFLDPPAGS